MDDTLRQEVFDFAPPQSKVDRDIRGKLEYAAQLIGRGSRIAVIETLRAPVVVRKTSVAVTPSSVALLRHVAAYLGKAQRVEAALEAWAKRETDLMQKRRRKAIARDTAVDWRPTESVPEDFYAY